VRAQVQANRLFRSAHISVSVGGGFHFSLFECYHPLFLKLGGKVMADDSGNGILWFLAGLGVGAALGVLYAPKSGQETREAILSAAEEGTDAVRDHARRYRDQAEQAVHKGREYVGQQTDQLRSAFEAGRQAYREATATPAPEGGSPKP
jgi:gas vesicle protein